MHNTIRNLQTINLGKDIAALPPMRDHSQVRKPSRNLTILLALLAILAMAIAVRLSSHSPAEPQYAGKPLSVWLSNYDDPRTLNWPRPNNPADAAIRSLGTNCFPEITAAFSVRDGKLKRGVNRALRSVRLPVQLPAQDIRQRRALAALGALRWDGAPMVPVLAEALEHMDLSHYITACFWLKSLGTDAEAAVPALLRILTNQNDQLPRHFAVQTLSSIGARQRDRILPTLTQCLNDANAAVRLQARNELTREPWAPRTRPIVTDADISAQNLRQLELGTESERVAAASFFRHQPLPPQQVVPLLIAGLSSTNILLIQESAKTLGFYQAAASNSVPFLEPHFSHPKKYVRIAVSNSLAQIQTALAEREQKNRGTTPKP